MNDSPLRALVVDDEAPARSRLRHLLKGEAGFELAGKRPMAGRRLRRFAG
ncbi:MAG: hypothetical protein M5U12_37235 [Verrucomicrobia bacterium]|nr:hypothetical protein [Verrucomicrobiota bacterium]